VFAPLFLRTQCMIWQPALPPVEWGPVQWWWGPQHGLLCCPYAAIASCSWASWTLVCQGSLRYRLSIALSV
jgi:hypothetical protein